MVKEFWSERTPMWDRLYALDEDDEEVCANAAETPASHEPTAARSPRSNLVVTLTPYVPVATIPEDWDDGFDADRESLRKRALGKGEGGEETSKWVEKEVVSAVYVGNRPRETLARSERVVELPV
ncbi:serine/threonine protein phosphatase [Pseudohyphozyma bogoriensis]|nr:serine/threonine protein phosphatase [Pseudohyphozyma bogoriensis]